MPFSKLSSMLSFPMVVRVGAVDAASLASGSVEPQAMKEWQEYIRLECQSLTVKRKFHVEKI